MRILICGVITLFWLTMSVMYIEKEILVPSRRMAAQKKKEMAFPTGKLRLRIEQNGKPVGFIQTHYIPQENGFCKVEIKNKMVLSTSFLLLPVQMPLSEINMEVRALLAPGGRPQSFHTEISGQAMGKDLEATIVGIEEKKGYKMTITAMGQKFVKKVKQLPALVGTSPFPVISQVELGREFTTYNQLYGLTYRVKVLAKAPYQFNGKSHEAYLVEARLKNSPSKPTRAWLDKKGRIFRAEFPSGMTYIRVPVKEEGDKKEKEEGQ